MDPISCPTVREKCIGTIVVVKRDGADGGRFPVHHDILIGRKLECHIRVQLPQVSRQHARLHIAANNQAVLCPLSANGVTQLRGQQIKQPSPLQHNDVFMIGDRSFRFEYAEDVLEQLEESKEVQDKSSFPDFMQEKAEEEAEVDSGDVTLSLPRTLGTLGSSLMSRSRGGRQMLARPNIFARNDRANFHSRPAIIQPSTTPDSAQMAAKCVSQKEPNTDQESLVSVKESTNVEDAKFKGHSESNDPVVQESVPTATMTTTANAESLRPATEQKEEKNANGRADDEPTSVQKRVISEEIKQQMLEQWRMFQQRAQGKQPIGQIEAGMRQEIIARVQQRRARLPTGEKLIPRELCNELLSTVQQKLAQRAEIQRFRRELPKSLQEEIKNKAQEMAKRRAQQSLFQAGLPESLKKAIMNRAKTLHYSETPQPPQELLRELVEKAQSVTAGAVLDAPSVSQSPSKYPAVDAVDEEEEKTISESSQTPAKNLESDAQVVMDQELIETSAALLSHAAGVHEAVAYGYAVEKYQEDPESLRACLSAAGTETLEVDQEAVASVLDDQWLVYCYAREMAFAGGIDEDIAYGYALDMYAADPEKFRSVVIQLQDNSDAVTETDFGDEEAEITEEEPVKEEEKALSTETLVVSEEPLQGEEPAAIVVSITTTTSTEVNPLEAAEVDSVQDRCEENCQQEQDLKLVIMYAESMAENSGVHEDIAYGYALDTYLADPQRFRSMMNTPLSASCCDVEEEEDQTNISAEVIDSGDDDKALVDKYSEMMTEIGGADEGVAYGCAMDSFLSDQETFRSRVNVPRECVEMMEASASRWEGSEEAENAATAKEEVEDELMLEESDREEEEVHNAIALESETQVHEEESLDCDEQLDLSEDEEVPSAILEESAAEVAEPSHANEDLQKAEEEESEDLVYSESEEEPTSKSSTDSFDKDSMLQLPDDNANAAQSPERENIRDESASLFSAHVTVLEPVIEAVSAEEGENADEQEETESQEAAGALVGIKADANCVEEVQEEAPSLSSNDAQDEEGGERGLEDVETPSATENPHDDDGMYTDDNSSIYSVQTLHNESAHVLTRRQAALQRKYYSEGHASESDGGALTKKRRSTRASSRRKRESGKENESGDTAQGKENQGGEPSQELGDKPQLKRRRRGTGADESETTSTRYRTLRSRQSHLMNR